MAFEVCQQTAATGRRLNLSVPLREKSAQKQFANRVVSTISYLESPY